MSNQQNDNIIEAQQETIDELKKELAALRVEVEKLHGERCYICRPEDKLASEEGCSDCDERARLHHEIDCLRQERDAYREALERVYNNGKGSEVYPKSHVQGEEATAEFIAVETVLAAYPKFEKVFTQNGYVWRKI